MTVKEAALLYARSGLSVIPVNADKKPAIESWKPYQYSIADEEDICAWFEDQPSSGVAVICGEVSGDLAVLDIDDRTFSDWMRVKGSKLLATTWTVRTGSGKVHMYLRSRKPCFTTKIKSRTDLADIRANGQGSKGPSYVVAPPSAYDFKGIQGSYTTLFGGPEAIRTVDNAEEVFLAVARRFDPDARITRKNSSDNPFEGVALPEPPREVNPERAEELARELKAARISGKIKRTILQGVDPGKSEWSDRPDYSGVDWEVVNALVEKRFTFDEIKDIYDAFPVGEGRYRSNNGKTSGPQYLKLLFDNVLRHQDAKRAALDQARGENFEIKSCTKIAYETNPEYEITVEFTTGNVYKVSGLSMEDITQFSRLRNAIGKVSNCLPVLNRDHDKNYPAFANAVLVMSREETPPADSTVSGYLRMLVFQILRDNIDLACPLDRSSAKLGWRDDKTGTIWARGSTLYNRVSTAIRPAPNPTEIWNMFRKLGGREETLDREIFWVLPIRRLEEGL